MRSLDIYVVVFDEFAPEMPAVGFAGQPPTVCASVRAAGVDLLHRHLWQFF